MILHCVICSLQGTHISEDSAIATIDGKKLSLPLKPDMFTSPDPGHGIPAPWLNGVDWQTMKCPRGNHLPWGIDYQDIDQAIKDGGPKQILTDKGMISTKPKPYNQIFTCEKCGREIRGVVGYKAHVGACKG